MPWRVLAIAGLMAFAMWAPVYCIPPIEHIIKEELLLSHTQASLLFTGPLLMIIGVSVPAGFLADRIGIKKAAGIGIIILAVGAILRGTATDINSLLAFTFIYGAGLGWTLPNLPKMISGWVPWEKAGMATGIYTTGMLVAPSLAMAISMTHIFPITGSFQGVCFSGAFRRWSPLSSGGGWRKTRRGPPLRRSRLPEPASHGC